ncbi:hypothetical protein [Micromonospora sp. NBC_01796]|uniref:hypothetical protein n=1 Tax=Micromonospora sp. NBC_01796 TaxID=2975987 RepID=UPI002DD903F9|nr:hypothetical protein [Micromonospora sp. NBC_01796]WSA84601.1 hypothetical protein OIE47_30225 [Micromonospora sp. NBC_01796]
MSAGSIVQAPDGQPVVLGEIGQRVLLVNPRVRVWEVRLAPGESQPWHLHYNPYVVLNLETSPCRMDWLDGSPARFLSEQVGGVVHRPVSPVHMLTNHGEANYRNRIVELLDLGEEASGVPDPVVSPARPATGGLIPTEVFADDEVRVRGVEVEPGTRHRWQAGDVPVVVIGLSHPDTDGVHYLAPGGQHEFAADATGPHTFRLVELTYLGGDVG